MNHRQIQTYHKMKITGGKVVNINFISLIFFLFLFLNLFSFCCILSLLTILQFLLCALERATQSKDEDDDVSFIHLKTIYVNSRSCNGLLFSLSVWLVIIWVSSFCCSSLTHSRTPFCISVLALPLIARSLSLCLSLVLLRISAMKRLKTWWANAQP